MSIQNLPDKESFVSSVIKIDPTQIVVVVFTDSSKEESNSVLSMVEIASSKAANIKFYQVDTTTVPDIASKLGIVTAPVTLLFKGGQQVNTLEGNFSGPELKQAIMAAKEVDNSAIDMYVT